MDGTFFPYGAGEKCMQNIIRNTEGRVLLERSRCVQADNIKMNHKELLACDIFIWSHLIQPKFRWDCSKHVNEC